MGSASSGTADAFETQQERPTAAQNVLLLLADDLGYSDTSVSAFFTARDKGGVNRDPASTPNLERLASEGTVMRNFYSAGATCTPTRASIMTGKWPHSFDIWKVYAVVAENETGPAWLPRVPTMPEAFQAARFATGHIGKWHLGGMDAPDVLQRREKTDCTRPGPRQHGFEHFVSMEQGAHSWYNNDAHRYSCLYSEGAQHLIEDDEPARPSHDLSMDRFAQEAITFMNQTAVAQGKRFYTQVWFNAPHKPVEAIQPDIQNYRGCNVPDRRRKYLSIVSRLDHAIGTILDYLDETGLADNTLVMFASDNGPENQLGSSFPLRGNKRWLYEGGIRVPAIWRLPGIVPHKTMNSLGSTVDLLPTFLSAAGLSVPDKIARSADGVDLWPDITALPSLEIPEADIPWPASRRILFWNSELDETHYAARTGVHKLILDVDKQPIGFFDLERDPLERRSMVSRHSHNFVGPSKLYPVFQRLSAALKSFASGRQRTSFADKPDVSCELPQLTHIDPF